MRLPRAMRPLSASGAPARWDNGAPSRHRRADERSRRQTAYRTWMCVVCGFIYDEAEGLPEEGIAPGTRWEDVPDTWTARIAA